MSGDSSFIPYGRQCIDDDDIAAVNAVLRSDFLTSGPEVSAFEHDFCVATSAGEAVVCNSGTAALHLAALTAGIGEGDVAIVPAITFLATANAIRMCGGDVEFADVDPLSGLMTLEAAKAAFSRASSKGSVKAVLPVFLAGQPTDPEIYRWAKSEGLIVISDACHALGGRYNDGTPVGAGLYEDMATFSLHPVKMVAMGEGGMITTRNAEFAHKMRLLRSHGMTRDSSDFQNHALAYDDGLAKDGDLANPWYYEMPELGYNYRAPDILCALGRSQLSKLRRFHDQRSALADRYDGFMRDLAPLISPIQRTDYAVSGWHLYPVLIDFEALGKSRRQVMSELKEQGIGSQVHYIPVSSQPYYVDRYGTQDLPGANRYYQATLSLPLYASLSNRDQDRVIAALKAVIA